MPVPLQVTLGVVVAVLIAFVLFRRRRPATPAPPPPPPPADLADRLRALVASGKKIQAVKELREHTGMRLAGAKNYVESLPPGGPLPATPAPPAELSPATVARARELIAAGKHIHAVKAIREDTGWSLRDAKDAMERLRAGGPT
jgi:ribosomal protein L7/L12